MKTNYVDPEALAKFETATGASGVAAAITLAADEDEFHVIDWISWSYDDTPSSGSLSITIGGVTVWQVDITAGGPGHIDFIDPIYTNERDGVEPKRNEAVVITLADGSAAKKLNVRYR